MDFTAFLKLFIMSIQCPHCSKKFSKSKGLSIHFAKKHRRANPPTTKSPKPETRCVSPLATYASDQRTGTHEISHEAPTTPDQVDQDQAGPGQHHTGHANDAWPSPATDETFPSESNGINETQYTSLAALGNVVQHIVNQGPASHKDEADNEDLHALSTAPYNIIHDRPNQQINGNNNDINRKFDLFQDAMRERAKEDFEYLKAAADYAQENNVRELEAWTTWTMEDLQRRCGDLSKDLRDKALENEASTKSSTDHTLHTALQNQERLDHLDRELEGQSLLCRNWMSKVDDHLTIQLEQLSEASIVNKLTSCTDKDLEERIECRLSAVETEVLEHVTSVTRWMNAVADGHDKQLEGMSQVIEEQQHLISSMGRQILEMNDKIEAMTPDGGLKFQVKLSLQKVQAPDENHASPDSVLGLFSLNRTEMDMLHMEG
jgi:hypothetical protein